MFKNKWKWFWMNIISICSNKGCSFFPKFAWSSVLTQRDSTVAQNGEICGPVTFDDSI